MYSLAFRLAKAQKLNMDPDLLISQSIKNLDLLIEKYTPSPPPDFDEMAYLEANPDIAAAVNRGDFKNGFIHYLRHGFHEGRKRPSLK
jgi:hypothetical protein